MLNSVKRAISSRIDDLDNVIKEYLYKISTYKKEIQETTEWLNKYDKWLNEARKDKEELEELLKKEGN